MNIRESLNSLFPQSKQKDNLSVEEVNKRAREKADKEELRKMELIKRLNYENKRNRTGGLNKK